MVHVFGGYDLTYFKKSMCSNFGRKYRNGEKSIRV